MVPDGFGFAMGDVAPMQQTGFGLAAAVILDATGAVRYIIRKRVDDDARMRRQAKFITGTGLLVDGGIANNLPVDIARAMVTEWGMSESLGAINYDGHKRSKFLEIQIGPERGAYAEDTARLIDGVRVSKDPALLTEGVRDAVQALTGIEMPSKPSS